MKAMESRRGIRVLLEPTIALQMTSAPLVKFLNILEDTRLILFPAFLTPANAMLSVELTHLATMLESVGKAQNVSQAARKYSSTIRKAIWDTTVVNNIFAYETNGTTMFLL